MQKFIVYGAPRTGSHYLQSLINSHPAVTCVWDIFWGGGETEYCLNTYLAKQNLSRVPRFIGRKRVLSSYLTDFYRRFPGAEAAGFLLKWSTAVRQPYVLEWFRTHDVKVVHIVRDNSLIHQVALQLRRSGAVTSHSRAEIEFSKVRLDPDQIVSRLRASRRALHRHRRRLSALDALEIQYESFLGDEAASARRVLEFLNIEVAAGLTSEFKKTESESPAEMIENYDEIRRALAGTEFSKFLSE